MKKSRYFCKLFCVHSYSNKDKKVDQGVHLFFSFPKKIVATKGIKVCYKIIFINNQFIINLYTMIIKDIRYCRKDPEKPLNLLKIRVVCFINYKYKFKVHVI